MMATKTIRARFIKWVVIVLIILFSFWLMSVLKCDMSTPAY
jgi:hypothetical protein